MSPRIVFALVALGPLSACLSTAMPADAPQPAATMSPASAELTAGPGGRFLWTCVAPDIGSGWQFGLVEQQNETGREIVLTSAGSAAAVPLERREEDGLERFAVGANRIDIAPDGSARLSWAGATHPGQCVKGDTA